MLCQLTVPIYVYLFSAMQSDACDSNLDLQKSNEWLANSQDLEADVCRDFLRNVCVRGRKCRFKHLNQEECERLR